jgi:hypothetical protein
MFSLNFTHLQFFLSLLHYCHDLSRFSFMFYWIRLLEVETFPLPITVRAITNYLSDAIIKMCWQFLSLYVNKLSNINILLIQRILSIFCTHFNGQSIFILCLPYLTYIKIFKAHQFNFLDLFSIVNLDYLPLKY